MSLRYEAQVKANDAFSRQREKETERRYRMRRGSRRDSSRSVSPSLGDKETPPGGGETRERITRRCSSTSNQEQGRQKETQRDRGKDPKETEETGRESDRNEEADRDRRPHAQDKSL